MTTSLDECWQAYSVDQVESDASTLNRVQRRRAFMSGAMACLELMKSGRDEKSLMAEIVLYGRAVGSAAEGV